MDLNTLGSISSIVSLGGAVISSIFASKTVKYFKNTTLQYSYADILSRIKNIAEESRENKRKYIRGSEKSYEKIITKLNNVLYDLPINEDEIKSSIESIINRIDDCLKEQISIQQIDEKIATIEGREKFKDIDTIFREIVEIIKGKLSILQDKNSNNLFSWIKYRFQKKSKNDH
ncbi:MULTISPECIES: hypothetical protein [Niallia]|uniref:Uncharacterized protein n=1 Tax=Niallia hominis TaxID=3133173 RepID=A0ABV1EWA7_9BACI|nr:hypothetical protein [Niallia circulans]MCF2649077.1 hypothetical protein [Niallia circulans]